MPGNAAGADFKIDWRVAPVKTGELKRIVAPVAKGGRIYTIDADQR
jgi:hypothetical protein